MIRLKPLPPTQQPVVAALAPTQPYSEYWQSLDAVMRALLAQPPNVQTANYILALSDMAGIVEMNLAVANTLTIPPDNSVALPVGAWFYATQAGAGATTITAGAGVTIRNRSGLQLAGQWAVARIYKRAANTWVASGDLS